MSDAAPSTRVPRVIVAEYDYTDESGIVLFQCVRLEPKGFFQRRPDGKGGWMNDLRGVRLVLFKLPTLTGCKAVIVPEGEKDVLALRRIGLTATCNPMGASMSGTKSKWRDDYTQQLKAAGTKKVVVIPDADDAGRAHADSVARSCTAAGLDVKVVPLAAKDAADWIAAGGTKTALLELIKAAPRYVPKAGASAVSQAVSQPVVTRHLVLTPASAIPVRPTKWLWAERIPLGEFTLLGGREGVGKTILSYTFAADVTRGRLKGACFGTGRSVIVAATEDSWEQTIVPRLMAADADLTRVFRVDVSTSDDIYTALSLPRDLAALSCGSSKPTRRLCCSTRSCPAWMLRSTLTRTQKCGRRWNRSWRWRTTPRLPSWD